MARCSVCGEENSGRARFCQSCGNALVAAAPASEQRKVVTVVFTDVTGSTALGEKLDPESLRSVMSRYFDSMREAIERHGGTVEKFIGDAVMAVFGVPQLHEDDAIRAVRAADEMRDSLAALNAELDRERGVRILTRTGVNTGEVVAGRDPSAGERLVTGDAVNVAARLEQAAEPGEILLGASTYQLARDAVEVETVQPLDLKGKSEPVRAFRLLSVRAGAEGRERHLDSQVVGRDRQLQMLESAFDAVVADRACHAFTVLGPAGIGKSRLVYEFLERLRGRAQILRGRCLSYGDGITFWPVAEIVRAAAAVQDEDGPDEAAHRIRSLLSDDEEGAIVSARIEQLLGLAESNAALEEMFWAVRKLLEHVARSDPLVVVVDDIHWAEPTLLALIEHVSDWSRDAPILFLCIARPELLDVRPNWGGGKLNASSLLLNALSNDECDELIRNLLGATELQTEVRERILDGAEGNPLFVEEMLGMLIDDGLLKREGNGWAARGDLASVAVPPTIHALLAARLDRLSTEERSAIERGSVEGKVFHVGGVTTLSPEAQRPKVRPSLLSLVRKELIRPDRSELAGEDAFRFRHLLLRDAAYESMPKELRGDLHQRFATWLEERGSHSAEYDAIVAYHLERTVRLREELGTAGEHEQQLAQHAAKRYLAAGQAALARGDAVSARSLFDHAVALAPRDPAALIALAGALQWLGDFSGCATVLDDLEGALREHPDPATELLAEVIRLDVRSRTDPTWGTTQHLAEAKRLTAVAEQLGDGALLARTHLPVIPYASRSENLAAAERAIEHARRTRDQATLAAALSFRATELFWGPTPAAEGALRCEEMLTERVSNRVMESIVLASLGGLRGMLGEFEEARTLIDRSRSIVHDIGMRAVVGFSFCGGYVGWIAGDMDEADAVWREAYDVFDSIGEKNRLSSLAGGISMTLAVRGRHEEALEMARIGREAGAPDDEDTQCLVRMGEAIVRSSEGAYEEAIRLAREAVAFLDGRDSIWQQADAFRILGDVSAAAGRFGEAEEAYQEALTLFEAKGVLPMVERVREKLSALAP